MGAAEWDIVVIGAGIAGASVAAELAEAGKRVLVLEREAGPGYHATGRSAALYEPSYGPPVIRALTRASGPAFNAPPTAERPHPLLRPRDVLILGLVGQEASFVAAEAELDLPRLSAAETHARLPILRADGVFGALLDSTAADIDVEALHRQFLRRFAASGGALRLNSAVTGLRAEGGHWRIETPQDTLRAAVVVNAAGAWADALAHLAAVRGVGLVPKRRTALTVAAPAGLSIGDWPMVGDADETFYLRPDAGRLLLSPADETPSEPCDAQPDEWDVAVAIDRVQRVFDLPVRRIESRWAGLRSFVADKAPVVGYANDAPDFFWLAGQGGCGIQTAPALARMAAALLLERDIPAEISAEGVTAAQLAPARPTLADRAQGGVAL